MAEETNMRISHTNGKINRYEAVCELNLVYLCIE